MLPQNNTDTVYRDDLTGAPEMAALVCAVLERRIADACAVARKQVLPKQAGGNVRSLVEDAAAWLAEVEPMPSDIVERLERAVWEVAIQGHSGC